MNECWIKSWGRFTKYTTIAMKSPYISLIVLFFFFPGPLFVLQGRQGQDIWAINVCGRERFKIR